MGIETALAELVKLLPIGQALALIILVIIAKVLMQSRDQLRDLIHAVNGEHGIIKEMEKHQERDDEEFKEIRKSIGRVHERIDRRRHTDEPRERED